MARKKVYSYKKAVFFATKNTTTDALSLKNGRPGFKSYRNLLDPWTYKTERAATKKAREIFLRSCELIAQDMIDNGDTFLFPERETGVMFIGNPEAHGHIVPMRFKDPAFDLVSATGLISLARIFRRTIGGAAYRLTLNKKWLERIYWRRMEHAMKYPQ